MRWIGLIALLIALSIVFGGCQFSGEIENQAYVLVLALDRTEDGALQLTVRVPQIGKSGESSDEGDNDGSPYLTFAVSGSDWQGALDALQWATPRRVNLSHIEMIIASRALASEASFPMLMTRVADTPHLYANAQFVICEGSAAEFLKAGKTVIGTRMSAEIHSMLKQYASQSYIPDTPLADFCYTVHSIYGDPVAIWAYMDEETPPQSNVNVAGLVPAVLDSPMKQRFSGAALFRRGAFVRALSTQETRLLNLIRGNTAPVLLDLAGNTVELTSDGPCAKRVAIDGNDVSLSLSLRLSAPGTTADAELQMMNEALKSALTELVRSCQRLECDPLGFAECAASHFATVQQWLAFDWHGCYPRASVDVDVEIRRDNTA